MALREQLNDDAGRNGHHHVAVASWFPKDHRALNRPRGRRSRLGKAVMGSEKDEDSDYAAHR